MNYNSNHWSDKKSLLNQLEKLWKNGSILKETISSSDLFPRRLSFKAPDSKALSYDFEDVRRWVGDIQKLKGFHVVYKMVRHQIIGENRIPAEVWVNTCDEAVALLNRQSQVSAFSKLLKQTETHTPELITWIEQYPLKALSLADAWPKILDFVRWRQQHPDPDIYLRQVSLPGIDTKFIEQHRKVLMSLLDLTLPAAQIDIESTGVRQFEQRYGFRSKPEKIRFRLLDTRIPLLPELLPGSDYDVSVTANDFRQLHQNTEFIAHLKRVFITENEINFLAFPAQNNSLVIFGSGYGFEALAKARWLSQLEIFYWGDIDTHGFAILDQLRNKFPHVQSLLMDETTLMKHRDFWVQETRPEKRELHRLTTSEQYLYHTLLDNQYAEQLRLEQERVDYNYLLYVLRGIA